jgi:hypothetical protein
MGAIGDFNGLGTAKNKVVEVYFEENYERIDSEKTLFRLEHKDPTLKCIALADSFHSLYPDNGEGSFDHYEHEKRVMDVLDAVKSFPHLQELILAVDTNESILWREGNARNALFSVMRDLPSKVVITIRVAILIGGSVDHVAEMLKNCPNLKYLTICFDGWAPYGNGTVALVKSLSILPFLESVQLQNWRLYWRAALHLFIRLMKKKSLKSMAMLRTDMSQHLASKMLQIYKDSDECDQLEFLSFFREQWDFQWQEDIDLQLAETAHIKHTRRSVSDFINNIKSRDKSSNGRNEELQFITDIVDANEKDSEQEMQYDLVICRPDHLYALIQSKPDYIQRCVDLKREYSVSNKRQKII